MEDLPEALFAEIVKKITGTSDLNSLSLVSKQLYTNEAHQRGAIRVGCGLCPAREALTSLCSRFPNLWKVEIDYSSWTSGHGNQLDNKGLLVISSCCPSLTDLTLSFCSSINDSGLGYLVDCKKLMSLRLNSTRKITSSGLLSVVVACKSLSSLHLIECEKIGSEGWLDYLGWNSSLKELVVKNCDGICQFDFLKFGPGWMNLQKFEFEIYGVSWNPFRGGHKGFDPSYNAHMPSRYEFCCESLTDLRLAHFTSGPDPEIGLRFILAKCKALEKLCLQYVFVLNDNDLIAVSQTCINLRSISLWMEPQFYNYCFRTSFTDDSLKSLALGCPMLQTVELTFAACASEWPSEIGFTQKGLVVLIQSCPIRVLTLNGANFFNDKGMQALSSAPFLETLELVDCKAITDAGLRFIACAPCLIDVTLRLCNRVTDGGMAELVRAHKLESLVIEGCHRVSLQAMQGAARSVCYSIDCASHARGCQISLLLHRLCKPCRAKKNVALFGRKQETTLLSPLSLLRTTHHRWIFPVPFHLGELAFTFILLL